MTATVSEKKHSTASGTACIVCLFIAAVLMGVSSVQAEHRALLIGVGKYEKASGLKSLPFSVEDVVELEKVLAKRGYKTEVLVSDPDRIVSIDHLPTHARIQEKINSFFKIGSPGDSLVLAFAGHGVNINKDAFICPLDARVHQKKNLISVEWISERMVASGATHVTFFCDACQEEISDGQILRNVQDLKSGVGDRFRESLANSRMGIGQRRVAVVQSCSPGEFARADAQLRHGVFFNFLIEGINGAADQDRDGKLQHRELVRFVRNKVYDYVNNKFGSGQIVYEASEDNSDLPMLEFEGRPSWLPPNCVPTDTSRLVEVPGFGTPAHRFYSDLTMTPRYSKNGAEDQPFLLSDGSEMTIEFVLVPQLRYSDPPSFYISRDKITFDHFFAYEKVFQAELDASAIGQRATAKLESDAPVFLVTGREAMKFAADVCGSRLPSPEQWDIAFGLTFDQAAASIVGYPAWLGRQLAAERWAVASLQSETVTRENNPDVSPWGVRDMGSNGMEFTRYDPDWGQLIPHQNPPSSMELRGRSFRDQSGPLTLAKWKSAGLPNDVLFGMREVNQACDDISFRVVVEQFPSR